MRLPVTQQHLGHQNIATTIQVDGRRDRQSARAAAEFISPKFPRVDRS